MSLPSPGRRRAVTLLAVLPWAILLFQFLLVLPRYEELYRKLGLKLPGPIEALFVTSTWIRGHVFLAFLLTFALMGVSVGVAHAVQVTPVSRGRRFLCLLVVFLVPCLVFLATWLGVLWTQRKLVEGFNR